MIELNNRISGASDKPKKKSIAEKEPNKPDFKKMTGLEYMQYLDRVGGGYV